MIRLPLEQREALLLSGVAELSQADIAELQWVPIPASPSMLMSWRGASEHPFAISRAGYAGKLVKDVLEWTGAFEVELLDGDFVTLPIIPSTVTLSDVQVDGEPVMVIKEEDQFTTRVQGRGRHTVTVTF